jgi:competence protein ComGC
MNNPRKDRLAFTLIELFVILCMVALLAAMLLPALARTKATSRRISCTDNLKQLGLAFQDFAYAHNGGFPMAVSTANGGYSEAVGQRVVSTVVSSARGVFDFFMVMSNELASPKVLLCPAESDGVRLAATIFSAVIPNGLTNAVPLTNDLNTSYFVGVDATLTTPRMFLAGDHNLGSDGNLLPLRPFVSPPSIYSPSFRLSLGTNYVINQGVGWLSSMHFQKGNVVLGDCSVQQFNRARLQQALQDSGDAGGHPGTAFTLPVGCSGYGINRAQFP